MVARRRLVLGSLLLLVVVSPGRLAAETDDGRAKSRYRLQQLVERARKHYPAVAAAQRAVDAMEAKLFQARWAWIPQGTVKGLLAPAPEIQCEDDIVVNGQTITCPKTKQVIRHDSIDSINIKGIYGRIELEVGMPLYTFDKLGAAKRAATAGLEIRRAEVETTREKVAANVAKAYWGLKLAKEMLYTLEEGQGHLTKAIKKVEKDLDEEKGEVTETDLLRLKTADAEVEARVYEARKGQELARRTLAMLAGLTHTQLEVDDEPIEAVEGKPLQMGSYLKLAQQHRPEVKALRAAALARQAAVDLEKSRFYPDFLFVAMAGYGAASSVDDPDHGYYNDPFNFLSAGFGLAMRWKWDQVQQYGKLNVAKAEAGETDAKRREALAGIDLEVQKTAIELEEALSRLEATRRGSKSSRSWLVATVQNLEAGLSSPRDLVDALVAYFQMHLRYLQATYDVNVGWFELARVTGTSQVSQEKR
jgi:multidrug efflux system outer membrane protein